MGAAGFRDHIVICGWNTTAREMVKELKTDEYRSKVVVLHEAERNPAGEGVYYVRGDTTRSMTCSGRASRRPPRRSWFLSIRPTRRTCARS